MTTHSFASTTYEVWSAKGGYERRHETVLDLPRLEVALTLADKYKDEEVANARMELRKVNREFFVVKATTTRTLVEPA